MLSAGFVFAQTWVGPTTAPPGDNVRAPINATGFSQVKSGALSVGSNPNSLQFTVIGNSAFYGNQGIQAFTNDNGVLTPSNLYVSGKIGIGGAGTTQPAEALVIDGGNLKTTSLAHSTTTSPCSTAYPCNLRKICSDTTGRLVLCDIPIPTPRPLVGSITYEYASYQQTFSVPTGVTSITIQAWGGGGGGGGGNGVNLGTKAEQGGGGAGSGGYVTTVKNVSVGQSFNINVGGGGIAGSGGINNATSGSSGNSGGITTVTSSNVSISAFGGHFGVFGYFEGSSSENGGAGGGGSGGTITVGGAGTKGTTPVGGSGGSGAAGGTDPGCNSNGNPGTNGTIPGGGGGGGSGARSCSTVSKPVGTWRSGGSGEVGANGRVIISWP